MINCLSSVGNKYEDYSMLTSEKVLSSLRQHLLKLVIIFRDHTVLLIA